MSQDRRSFIKITTIAAATMVPVFGTIALSVNKRENEIDDLLNGSDKTNLEFHIIDNNLLNLHFYFINVKKRRDYLVPKDESDDQKSFMIVRLPQMHVSEKGFFGKDFNDQKTGYPDAKMSKYSYLAFEMWPDGNQGNKKGGEVKRKKIELTLENLLNWNRSGNFELITLVEWLELKNERSFEFVESHKVNSDFEKRKVWRSPSEKSSFRGDFRSIDGSEKSYYSKSIDEESSTYDLEKYKSMIYRFLDGNLKTSAKESYFIPITLFEFPEGVVLVPLARDSQGRLAEGDKKPLKQFWANKYVNQERTNEGYRKYEIWNNTLFYKSIVDEEANRDSGSGTTYKFETPSFRIAGLIIDEKTPFPENEIHEDSINDKCKELELEWTGFLPSLLDKLELTFLTQFAKSESTASDLTKKEYDIKEENGLFFTGLGIITNLKYYNEDPPPGVDLIEYVHTITQGRDIHIKVARIGINSKTGKRYKHVIEGKRKIKKGKLEENSTFPVGPTSFIELKQYCECIEPIKKYHFNEGEANFSFDSDHFEIPVLGTISDVFKPTEKNKPHFRRFPWKEIRTIEKKRIPITPYQDDSNGNPLDIQNPQQALWFWPIHENTLDNPEYVNCNFNADDWDSGTLNLSTPFMFIRKSVFEGESCVKKEKSKIIKSYFAHNKDNYTNPLNERRKIKINNQKIAFTIDPSLQKSSNLSMEKAENENLKSRSKTHNIETDFIEPYFNFIKPENFTEAVFRKTDFPLLPQLLRAKVYVDHIKEITQKRIPSVVEYHENYLQYKFEEESSNTLNGYANAAKQILANTDAFINGTEEVFNDNYKEIKIALYEAKSKLGNLAVPDIIPDTISLEKFGITLPKDINESIQKGKTVLNDLNKIKSFNPRELFRGKLSDVCGLDLTAILDELIPAEEGKNQTPLFEINKVVNKLSDDISGSSVYIEVKSALNKVKSEISRLENIYSQLAEQIKEQETDLNIQLKVISNKIPNSAELDELFKSQFEKLRTSAFEDVHEYIRPKDVLSQIENFKTGAVEYLVKELNILSDEFYSHKDILDGYFNNYKEELDLLERLPDRIKFIDKDLNQKNRNLKDFVDQELKKPFDEISSKFYSSLQDKREEYCKSLATELYGTIDEVQIKVGKEVIHYVLNEKFKSATSYRISKTGTPLSALSIKELKNVKRVQLAHKISFFERLVINNINGNEFQKKACSELQKLISAYRSVEKEVIDDKLGAYSKDIKIKIERWANNLERFIVEEKNLGHETLEAARKIQGLMKKVNTQVDFLKKFEPESIFLNQKQLNKNIKDVKRRLHQKVFNEIESIEDEINEFYTDKFLVKYKSYHDTILEYQKAYQDYQELKTKYDQGRITLQVFQVGINKYNEILKKYNDLKTEYNALQTSFVDTLKSKANGLVKNYIKGEARELQEAYEKVYGKITSNLPDTEYSGLIDSIKKAKKKYTVVYNEYLSYIKSEGSMAEASITSAIKEYINKNRDAVEKVKEAENLLRLLTSIKKQDLTYNWETDKFKDVNLGAISFKKQSNPNTSLFVNVRSTTHFKSGSVPPTIEKVVNYSENKFSNFGISLFNSLIVNFKEISFIAGSESTPQFDVKIKDVKFEGALSFVQAFESYMQTMGKGLVLSLHSDHVALSYSFLVPDIGAPSFNFFNISLNIGIKVFFDNRPMTINFSLGKPESKFGISAGVYAGFGFFGLEANPKEGITKLDCALEAGAWQSIRFGPFSGHVKLAFGFRYTKSKNLVRLEGYIVAEGRLSFWICDISTRIYLGIISENSYVEGICTVSASVKIGFVKKSFSGSYYKKIAGAKSNNSGESAKTLALIHKELDTELYGYYLALNTIDDDNSKETVNDMIIKKLLENDELDEEVTNVVGKEEWEIFMAKF